MSQNYTVTVDLTDTHDVNSGIRLKQGDGGRSTGENIRLYFYVLRNGREYFNSDNIPSVVFRRPNGTSVIGTASTEITTYTKKYYYDIAGSELQYAGKIFVDLKFTVESTRYSTYTFTIDCVPDTIQPGQTGADIYTSDYLTLKSEVEDAADRAAASATAAAQTDVGQLNTRFTALEQAVYSANDVLNSLYDDEEGE